MGFKKITLITIWMLLILGACNNKNYCPDTGPARPDFKSKSGLKKRDKNGHIKKDKPKSFQKKN